MALSSGCSAWRHSCICELELIMQQTCTHVGGVGGGSRGLLDKEGVQLVVQALGIDLAAAHDGDGRRGVQPVGALHAVEHAARVHLASR